MNAQLGLDPKTGAGEWPADFITHLAGVKEGGGACVIEVWESQQAQAEFVGSPGSVLPWRPEESPPLRK